MAVVTYDDRSFLIDGRRVWLVSGAVHYFRTPAALWQDRLLKAKRCGLNCISTSIPWNFHETAEGRWNLTGDHDLAAFVRLAGDLRLYVILKPGPYVGADCDNGGLPGWLSTKTGIGYRTSNATYTHYYDKYFRQVLPRLADLQVTHGGNIILIQNESHYDNTVMPDRLSYLEFVSQLFRRSGFDIPIITCNDISAPPVPGAVETAAGYGTAELKRLRQRSGNGPMMISEFRPAPADCWGEAHAKSDPRELARKALEALGCGAMFDYYTWHGGTNFDFWTARSDRGPAAYLTTSYDGDAPLAEGGGLTEKYYFSRLANLLANHMGPFIAGCTMDAPGVTVQDCTQTFNISGPAGRWAVITNNGRYDIKTARVALPDGLELDVSLEPLGAVAIPVGVTLSPTVVMDFANLMPLGLFNDRYLVFHGPAGFAGKISLNGTVLAVAVPAGETPTLVEAQGLTVVVMNSDLAMRTWAMPDGVVVGPQFVGATIEQASAAPHAKDCMLLPLEDKPSRLSVTHTRAGSPPHITLGAWKRLAVCVEPVAQDLQWQAMPGPRDVDQIGIHHGYAWYRIVLDQPRPRKVRLYLPECEDRATLFLNGELIGTWGRGADAEREPIGVSLGKGANTLVALVDNLGRFSDEPNLGGRKGLFGHMYDAKAIKPLKFKVKADGSFTRRLVPRQHSHLAGALEKMPMVSAELSIPLTQITPLHLSFHGVPHAVAILCNDRMVKFFPQPPAGENFGDVLLAAELRKGKNNLRVLLWGDVKPEAMGNFGLHAMEENLTENAAWSFRTWSLPHGGGHVVGKDQPAWYVTPFKYKPTDEPLFLHIIGAKKGQIFLNGHNVGRFWTVGPQEHYYLPACWLKEENELMIFEEGGLIPAKSSLEFRPQGPYHK